MRVGFTGTREGLTGPQLDSLNEFIGDYAPKEAHHGCCIGADEAFARLAGRFMHTEIIGHPGDNRALTMDKPELLCDEVLIGKPNLDRNRDIVDDCDVLFACPKGPEEHRSGTWATIRYARKVGRRTIIFWPDGSVDDGG